MTTHSVRLEVLYSGIRVQNQILDRSVTERQPEILFEGVEGKLYTLLMVDPDAPAKSWLHWLITNISGAIPSVLEGDIVLSYAPPTPPSGIHRYFFTLYEQSASIVVKAPEQRGNFNVEAFEKQYALRKVATRMVKVPAN